MSFSKSNGLLICFTLVVCGAARASTMEEIGRRFHTITGKIKSIGTDDKTITVRIVKTDGTSQTLPVCSTFYGGDSFNIAEQERARLLHQAFDRGETVQVSYDGPIEPCLAQVEISKEEDAKVEAKTVRQPGKSARAPL